MADVMPLLERLKRLLSEGALPHNARLPSERSLCVQFGVGRAELRRALAVMESDGLIWRHVGRGTFVGAQPVLNLADVAYLGELASPTQVMIARIAVEPELARLAAAFGTKNDFDRILEWTRRCRAASDWRSYEASDNNLHRAIARATHNKLLLHLFDTLNTVRRSTVWGQRRTTQAPGPDHFSFDQHDAILEAITGRDGELAAEAMRTHLHAVRDHVLPALRG